jgi:integrase
MKDDTTTAHEPKIREVTVRVKGREYPRVIVDFGEVNGRRERRTFKTRALAERALATWRKEQAILSRQIGNGAKRFLTGDVQDAAAALQVLGPGVTLSDAATLFKTVRDIGLDLAHVRDAGDAVPVLGGKATLLDAARFYMERHFPEGGERTIDELVEDYIESRRMVDRRPDTLKDIRGRLGCAVPRAVKRERGGTLHLKPSGFAFDFKGVPVAHITTTDLEKWMEQHAGKAKTTWRNARVYLVGLFNFAKARKYIRENPAEPLETPRLSKRAKPRPYVLTVEDAGKVLHYTAAAVPDMVPYMALCLFAGIRPTECTRLDWGRINFDRREIDIQPDASKTGDERFVEMSDNLVAWLLPYRKPSGLIHHSRKAFDKIRRNAGIRWKADCMRHTYGSMHLAQYDNAGKTALQMGHRTIDMLFEHYRRAVRKEDAARFWAIRPAAAASNVIAFSMKAG